MTEKVQKIHNEVERLQNELIQEKEKGFSSDSDDACILELQNVLTYIDSMQEEPKKCMYSKDNYTDEDRKILRDGCEEDCKIDFEQELYKAFGHVKDFTLCLKIARRFYEMGRNYQEPVSEVWHDANEEQPEEYRDFAFVDYDDVMWSRYRIEDLCHIWQSYVNMTGMTKWAYTSDLIKL